MFIKTIAGIELDAQEKNISTSKECKLYVTTKSLIVYDPVKSTTVKNAESSSVFLHTHDDAVILVLDTNTSRRQGLVLVAVPTSTKPQLESLLSSWRVQTLHKSSVINIKNIDIPSLMNFLSSLDFYLDAQGLPVDICCPEWFDTDAELIFSPTTRKNGLSGATRRLTGLFINHNSSSKPTSSSRFSDSTPLLGRQSRQGSSSSSWGGIVTSKTAAKGVHVKDIFTLTKRQSK